MPHLTGPMIQDWLADFRAEGYRILGEIRVLEMADDAVDDAFDAGLVVIRMESASTDTYIQRRARGASEWFVTFGKRDRPLELSSANVQNLADELSMVSRLAAYLEGRTRELLARAQA